MKGERDNDCVSRWQRTTHSEVAPMAILPVLSWIGNAAAVLLGKHGAVSAQAEAVGCSRQTAYDHADKVEQAVADAQLPGPSRADLLNEIRWLREDNQRLREQLTE